jgi:predicted AAA+ superfamily ATPase
MLKDSLKIVIREFHEAALPDLVPRHLVIDHNVLRPPVNKILTITGARRAGKTFFLFQLMKEFIAAGRDITDFIYINFS